MLDETAALLARGAEDGEELGHGCGECGGSGNGDWGYLKEGGFESGGVCGSGSWRWR